MSKSPAFQWYPKDFLTDLNVIVMTLEQRGAYITLLSQCWLEGSLPMEPAKLQAICNHPSNWDEIWDGVKSSFIEKNGQYINPRLEKERIKQQGWLEKSSKGGRRSAELRRESKGGSNMVATNRQPSGNSSSSSSSSSKSKSYPSKSEFERFYKIYPRKKAPRKVEDWFKTHKPAKEVVDQMLLTVQAFLDSGEWGDPQFIPYPCTWLNRGGWDEKPDIHALPQEITYNDLLDLLHEGKIESTDDYMITDRKSTKGDTLWIPRT